MLSAAQIQRKECKIIFHFRWIIQRFAWSFHQNVNIEERWWHSNRSNKNAFVVSLFHVKSCWALLYLERDLQMNALKWHFRWNRWTKLELNWQFTPNDAMRRAYSLQSVISVEWIFNMQIEWQFETFHNSTARYLARNTRLDADRKNKPIQELKFINRNMRSLTFVTFFCLIGRHNIFFWIEPICRDESQRQSNWSGKWTPNQGESSFNRRMFVINPKKWKEKTSREQMIRSTMGF